MGTLRQYIKKCVRNEIDKLLNEGVDFDYHRQIVSYNPHHQLNVDTSIEHNPTVDTTLIDGVDVWSIFRRKNGIKGDGNPLIHAMKGEGWKFRSRKDQEAIYNQFDRIADKFVEKYPVGVTIIVPSGNTLNHYIANVVMSKSKNSHLINDVVCKLTVDDVDAMVMDKKSYFRKVYQENFNYAYTKLWKYLSLMETERNGFFSRHFVRDGQMRDALDKTFKISNDVCADDANLINSQDVLIIDDTISRGQTIREICNIINDTFVPKSITVLTLFSKKY